MRSLRVTYKVHRWIGLIDLWRCRSRGRWALVAMNDRELRDIGRTRYDVFLEARKPFWRE